MTAESTPETGESTDTEAPQGAETPTEAPETPERLPDDHPVVKALAKANKEAEAARLKVKEFEDAQKSDLDRLTDEVAAEKDRADNAEAELARLRAALKHGLEEDDLDLLGNGTAEEIEARAERLAQRLTASGASRKPAPDPSQGRVADNTTSTAAQFAAAISGL